MAMFYYEYYTDVTINADRGLLLFSTYFNNMQLHIERWYVGIIFNNFFDDEKRIKY